MKLRLIKTAAAVIAAVLLLHGQIHAAPVVSAQSAILIDAKTGRVLWEHSADKRSLIASTTKIMTGLLIAEECELEAEVLIPDEAVGIEGSSLHLSAGDIRTVEELLYGTMLHSGNDAAAVLALYCGGSISNFVKKMNRKAQELDLQDTHFANPHGLDSAENYSTARDLARLTAYAMKNEGFRSTVSAKSVTFGSRTYTNHNKLLWRYPGAIGVKTGYTMSAGRILVSCAERDGRCLIAVTINDPNDWRDHATMLDYGFSFYSNKVVAASCEVEAAVPVIGGSERYARAVLREDYSYPVSAEENVVLEYRTPAFVYPPVMAGEPAGELAVLIDGNQIAVLPLCWKYSVLEGA